MNKTTTKTKHIPVSICFQRILAPHQLPPELVEERGPNLYPILESHSKCPSEFPVKCPSVVEAPRGSIHSLDRKVKSCCEGSPIDHCSLNSSVIAIFLLVFKH